jgi:16S rRNA (uracil1498-N3)-methyltransferase
MKRRTTNRIYIAESLSEKSIIVVEKEIAHYMGNVLRLKLNEEIRVFNAQDGEFLAVIYEIAKKEIRIFINGRLRSASKNPKLTLALCMIKNDRWATAIDMAVQLGVTDIIPLISKYTVHKNFNLERCKRIIIESTEQSERLDIALICEPILLTNILSKNNFDCVLYANEIENAEQKISSDISNYQNICLIVGPEGGFSPEELDYLAASHCVSVSLGQNILRSETACCKLISYIQFLKQYHA